jgi:hypothetical protein
MCDFVAWFEAESSSLLISCQVLHNRTNVLDFAISLVISSPKNIGYTPIDQDNFIVLYFIFSFKI